MGNQLTKTEDIVLIILFLTTDGWWGGSMGKPYLLAEGTLLDRITNKIRYN